MKKLSYPLLVSIQVTDSCNCNCKYCYNIPRTNHYLSRSDFDLILHSLVRGKVFHVVLEGGEPLLHKDLLRFCRSINESELDFTVITNATLVTPVIAKTLGKLQCNIIVSLDSVDHSSHNTTRENCDKALSGIETFLSAEVPVGINTVISRYNIDNCTDIIDYFYPRIRRFSFLRLISRTQHDETVQNLLSYSQQQFDELGMRLGNYKRQFPDIKIISPFNFPNDDTATFQETLDVSGCLAGTTYITIKPNLDVIPCSYAQNLVVGNLKKSTFKSIWESPKLKSLQCSFSLPCSINLNVVQDSACSKLPEYSSRPEFL